MKWNFNLIFIKLALSSRLIDTINQLINKALFACFIMTSLNFVFYNISRLFFQTFASDYFILALVDYL